MEVHTEVEMRASWFLSCLFPLVLCRLRLLLPLLLTVRVAHSSLSDVDSTTLSATPSVMKQPSAFFHSRIIRSPNYGHVSSERQKDRETI